ncbi:ABC transporter ATP-binding protein [Rhizosphaericola mali]|uniref:ABC transporter ATP-binding protein n=1 Tax=Rhizosphaericola mali TaxID=2545455 RepID=A0A5P2G6Q5_9BACT|nr:ABC transporter ATP-binding protein [Rhizosphaericola mali]
MRELSVLNKYFWKYRYRFLLGILFVISSNYFAIIVPEITGYIGLKIQSILPNANKKSIHLDKISSDYFVKRFINWMEALSIGKVITYSCLAIIVASLIRGVLMFCMRQTLIVMSRHIEYDQKNEVYDQYQKLDAEFYKSHTTGDLMNRMAEDVSRVRSYTGPAIMYLTNIVALVGFSVYNMLKKDVHLTLMVLLPLPILGVTIYIVNSIINKKSERVQALLSDLTTNAQESYSGIRVIKSFVQESAMLHFFRDKGEQYRKNAISLAQTDAIYFPSMTLMIGLSTLTTIYMGSKMAIDDGSKVALIVEFVIYINMLTFPVSSIGWVASMMQRAAASQKRLNEFLKIEPTIKSESGSAKADLQGDIRIKNVSFTYPHTGIKAISNLSLDIKKGEKVLVIGKTGSGKTSMTQLLMRFFDPDEGSIEMDGVDIRKLELNSLREQMSYVPQDVFLFSDTIFNNINFGLRAPADIETVRLAAKRASIDNEILELEKGYDTLTGERGVTLSGGQKQRISIARAFIKQPHVVLFDDCLSAVDNKTEHEILEGMKTYLHNKTAIIITHRIFTTIDFDQIIVIDAGKIVEHGTHNDLLNQQGYYTYLYQKQILEQKK